jgi:hypothetical protein
MKRREGLLGLAAEYWPLFLTALAGLYLVAIYGSDALAAMVGGAGSTSNLLHEVFHDVRHAAGFMCH